jgi:DNA-binding PadR family transcriptional regulator
LKDSELSKLMSIVRRSDRTKFRHQVINPLIMAGLIEMTIPDKPRSRLQKYRITEKGRTWLRERKQ